MKRICLANFGICLGICSICGVFVQYVGYLFNMWLICSMCGVFVQSVAYLFNMWLNCSICCVFVQYIAYLFNIWLLKWNWVVWNFSLYSMYLRLNVGKRELGIPTNTRHCHWRRYNLRPERNLAIHSLFRWPNNSKVQVIPRWNDSHYYRRFLRVYSW